MDTNNLLKTSLLSDTNSLICQNCFIGFSHIYYSKKNYIQPSLTCVIVILSYSAYAAGVEYLNYLPYDFKTIQNCTIQYNPG